MIDSLLVPLPPSPGDIIDERQIELRVTQADWGELSGMRQGHNSRFVDGYLDARWSTIERLSDALESVNESNTRLANAGYGLTRLKPIHDRWQRSGPAKYSITRFK